MRDGEERRMEGDMGEEGETRIEGDMDEEGERSTS